MQNLCRRNGNPQGGVGEHVVVGYLFMGSRACASVIIPDSPTTFAKKSKSDSVTVAYRGSRVVATVANALVTHCRARKARPSRACPVGPTKNM